MYDEYEKLSSFLASWFHQDFDFDGESLSEVMTSFLRSARPEETILLRQDIHKFLAAHPDCSGTFLESYFQMEVDPLAFAPTARDFLEEIDRKISESLK